MSNDYKHLLVIELEVEVVWLSLMKFT